MSRVRNTPNDFWGQVVKSQGCWEWMGHCVKDGYGHFRYVFESKSSMLLTHRLSWYFKHGTIPEGLLVLHKCDNPPCVNPDHLFLGTHQDNSNDKYRRGRSVSFKGSANGNSKLKEIQVIGIKKLLKEGNTTNVALGKEFGVSEATIRNIKKGNNWKEVAI